MIRNWQTIRVRDVVASAAWYTRLLGCRSPMDPKSGDRKVFDLLEDVDGTVLLCLVAEAHDDPWHDQPGPNGRGASFYFVIDDFDAAWQRARELEAEITQPAELGTGGYRTREFVVLDPDGYRVGFGDHATGWLATR